MQNFCQIYKFLTVNLFFIQEIPFVPRVNVKSKPNFEVRLNDNHQVSECTDQNFRMNVCMNIHSEICCMAYAPQVEV